MNQPAATADAVRSIVEEVLRRIAAGNVPAAGATAAASPPSPPSPSVAPLPDRVITLDLVERLSAGTSRIVVGPAAVITPSARDRARERGIEIVRGGSQPAAAPTRPFVVAHADAGVDAAGVCAAIARGVPGAQQLPATGLADVIATLAHHASHDAARGVLVTPRAAAATVLANRSSSLRAVTGRDAAALLAAASECGANLIVIKPGELSMAAASRLAAEFAARSLSVPADLAVAPAGCGCKH